MMATKTVGLTSAVASVALAVLLASPISASAQDKPLVDQEADQVKAPVHNMHKPRPLTVRRAVPAEAPGPGPILAAPLGIASTLVGLPFQVIGGVVGTGAGPRSGGVTNVRYAGAGPKEAELDQGFVSPVPVDKSGPIYVVKNGDPTVNPISFIGAPIAAVGTIVQAPFQVLGVVAPKL